MSDSSQSTDAQLGELLQELRVALPGVQVLLAFLLTVPFNARFEIMGPEDRAVFFVGVLSAAIASVLMIAPSAHHRFAWPVDGDDLEQLLRIGTVEARTGFTALGVSIVASLFVVSDVVFGRPAALGVSIGLTVVVCALWVALPRKTRGPTTRDPIRAARGGSRPDRAASIIRRG